MLANGDIFHGDHHPVSVAEGRKSMNLFDISRFADFDGFTVDGCEVSAQLNKYHASFNDKTSGFPVEFSGKQGSYCLSADVYVDNATQTASTGNALYVYFYYSDGTHDSARVQYGDVLSGYFKLMFASSDSKTVSKLCFSYGSGNTNLCKIKNIMLNEGSTPLPYEPYGTVADTIFEPAVSEQTGKVLEFPNSYNHFAKVSVAGKSEQVQLAGKNLMPVNSLTEKAYWADQIVSNVTNIEMGHYYTVSADVEVTGLSTNGNNVNNYAEKLVGLNFFHVADDEDSFRGTVIYASNRISGEISVGDHIRLETTVYIPTTHKVNAFLFYGIGNNAVGRCASVIVTNLQIEEGQAATAFEPYCGGIPSPNPDYPQPIESIDSVELVSRGRNLLPFPFDADKWNRDIYCEVGNIELSGDGFILNCGVSDKSDTAFRVITSKFFKLPKNSKVTLSLDAACNFDNSYWLQVDGTTGTYSTHLLNDDGVKIFSNYKGPFVLDGEFRRYSWTFNTDDNGNYRLSIGGDNPNYPTTQGKWLKVRNVQLELGETAHDYEPYVTPATITDDLQGHKLRSLPDGTADEYIRYRDGRRRIVQRVGIYDLSKHVWSGKYGVYYVRTNGDRSAGLFRESPYRYLTKIAAGSVNQNLLCNVAESDSQFNVYNDMKTTGVSLYVDPSCDFILTLPASIVGTTIESFNTWLSEQDEVLVQFPLAEQVTIPLPSIDPLPTYWPNTVIYDEHGNDISAYVKVVE